MAGCQDRFYWPDPKENDTDTGSSRTVVLNVFCLIYTSPISKNVFYPQICSVSRGMAFLERARGRFPWKNVTLRYMKLCAY